MENVLQLSNLTARLKRPPKLPSSHETRREWFPTRQNIPAPPIVLRLLGKTSKADQTVFGQHIKLIKNMKLHDKLSVSVQACPQSKKPLRERAEMHRLKVHRPFRARRTCRCPRRLKMHRFFRVRRARRCPQMHRLKLHRSFWLDVLAGARTCTGSRCGAASRS